MDCCFSQRRKLAGTGALYRFSHGERAASFKDKDSGHFILKRCGRVTKGTDCEPQAQQSATNLLGFQGGEWTQGWEGPRWAKRLRPSRLPDEAPPGDDFSMAVIDRLSLQAQRVTFHTAIPWEGHQNRTGVTQVLGKQVKV